MTEWNEKTEKLMRDLGDHFEKQIKDFLNPKASVAGTMLRNVFRHAVTGLSLKRRIREAGVPEQDWLGSLVSLVNLAEQNGSDAGEKIKKALVHVERISKDFETGPDGFFKNMKDQKNKGYTF